MPATRGLAELTLDGLAVVFGCFKTAEYGSWIAVTILANSRGGVREAAAVLVAQLVPATLVAVNVGALQARHGSRRVLIAGLLTQCCGLAGVAALLLTGAPRLVVYASAAVAAAAMVTSRPSISALLPSLSPDPRSLTKAHVVLGWLDGASSLLGPAIAAACLLVWSQAASFVVFAVLAALASVLASRLRPAALAPAATDEPARGRLSVRAALRTVAAAPGPRAALLLLGAQGLVIGCLDLLVVVVANRTHTGTASAGWYGTALGAGALIGGSASVVLIGRRFLWRTAVLATVAAAAAVAALSWATGVSSALATFAVIGALAAVILVSGRAVLARLTDLALVEHVFAFAEALESAMLLAGALIVPAVVVVGGAVAAFVVIAGLLVATAALITRPLATAEGAVVDAVARVAVLRRADPLQHLGAAALEALARAARVRDFAPGEALIRQGEPGTDFFVLTTGHVQVTQGGRLLVELGPGAGVGELALLLNVPRTATVRAIDHVSTLRVDRDSFLVALTRQPPPGPWDTLVRFGLEQGDDAVP